MEDNKMKIIDKNNIDEIKRLVSSIQISMEGVSCKSFESIRGKNTYSKVISAIELIIDNDIPLIIAITLIDSNIKDVNLKIIYLRGIYLKNPKHDPRWIYRYDILRDEYNIQVELGDIHTIMAVVSIGDTMEMMDRLIFALNDIKNELSESFSKLQFSNNIEYQNLKRNILKMLITIDYE